MSTIVAIVKSLVGQVFAVSLDGLKRQIFEGERLLMGEQVVTGLGGEVTLQLANGELIDVAQNSSWQAAPGAAQAEDDKPEPTSGLEQALTAGFDPTVDLEAPAAGPGTGGGTGGAAGGGHSFVLLGETGQQLEAVVGFDTSNRGLNGTDQNETFGTGEQTNQTTAAETNLVTPAANAPSVALTNDSGTSATDLISNDGTLAIGGVEPGSLVEYSTDGGSSWNTNFTPSEGTNTVLVRQTTTDGSTSASSSLTFTLDTQVATPTLTLTTDSGVAGDLISNDGSYSVSGTEAGATVEYSIDGTTWSTAAPTAVEGSNTIQVRQTDAAGNISAPSSLTFTLDTQAAAPTVTIATDTNNDGTLSSAELGNATTVSVSVALPTGTVVGDTLNVTLNGVAQTPIVLTQTQINNGITFDVARPADGQNITASATVTDAANNTSPAGSDSVTVGDTTAPTVSSIVMADTALSVGETSLVTITFSEAVVAFDNTDVSVENGTLSALSSTDGGVTWTGTFTPSVNVEDTSNLITVAATYTDTAGNAGTGASSANYQIDTQAPVLSISDNVAGVANGPVTFTFSFTEAVTGFSADDVSVANGTKGAFTSVDGQTYTLVVTPTGGEITVAVADGAAVDAAGNASTAANATQAVDISPPTVASIVMADTALSVGETSLVTITFSEAVSGFDNTDVTVENGTLSALSSTDGGVTWTGTFTPSVNVEDTSNLITVAATYTDTAGNAGTGASSANYQIDTQAPVLSISDNVAGVANGPVTFTFSFTEAVTGFSADDVSVANGTKGAFTSVDGQTYTLVVTPTGGEITVAVADGAAVDAASNASTAANATQAVDISPPKITGMSVQHATEGADLVCTVTLDKASGASFNLPHSIGGGTASLTDYGTPIYSNGVTVVGTNLLIPAGVSSFSITLPTVDDSLSEATETVPFTFGALTIAGNIYDNDAVPSLSINNISVNEDAGTATFTVTLSAASGQAVSVNYASSNGSATAGSDYTTVSGTLNFAAGELTQTITVPISDDGLVEVSENFTITLSNPSNATLGVASGTATINDNDSAPTVASIVMADTALSVGETSLVTITFSEAVVAFDNTDVSVENGTLSALSSTDGGVTWTGTFTPSVNVTDTTNLITVAATYTDTAGNAGTGASSANYQIDTQAPVLSISDNVAGVANGPVTFTFSFTEAVTGFSADDVSVANGTKGAFTSVDGQTYTLVVTPTGGEITVAVADGAAVDAAGNASTAANATQAVDIGAPTVASIVMADTALSVGETSLVTITFSEAVVAFDNTDVTVENGTLSALSSTDGGVTWTGTFTPSVNVTDTTNLITVAATYTDTAGNAGTGASSANYQIDTQAPVLSISDNVAGVANGPVTFTFSFTEAVTGFSADDVSVANGTKGAFTSVDGQTYTLVVTPTGGEITVAVADGAAVDAAGNASTAANATQAVDIGAPTVASIVMADTALSVGETSLVTITFSEAVVAFDNTDVTVENGTLSALSSTDGGVTWTGTFTPSVNVTDTTNLITVAATYTDTAGNAGTGASSANYQIDTQAPVLSISDNVAGVANGPVTFTFSFTEAVTGFSADDVSVANGTKGAFTSVDGQTYTLVVTPTGGEITVAVADGAAVDAAGNASTAANATQAVDIGAPTVASIVMADTALSVGETSLVTITFSEAVVAFDNTDVSVENGTLSALSSTDGGVTWTGTFTPSVNVTDTSNLITVAATYTDTAGNAGTGASSANYQIDTQAPVLSISDNVAGVANGPVTFTFSFTEAVTGFSADDVSVANGTKGAFTSVDGQTYTLVVTPTGGEITVAVAANAAQDAAGNASTAANATQAVDIGAPTVASIVMADTALSVGETSLVTITFSEAVSGFDNTDVTVENGTLSALSSTDGGVTWTGTFTPSVNVTDTTNLITVAATYTDTAGNAGTGASSANYQIDTQAPVLSISDNVAGVANGPVTFTFSFTEAVTGFSADDVTVANGTKGAFTSVDGQTYTLVVTPTGGEITVAVADGAAVDAAGNASTAANATQAVDIGAPTVASIVMADTALSVGETSLVTITFSEAVVAFDNTDVSVENGTLSALSSTDGGVTWTGTFTPSVNVTDTTNLITVAATYTDTAGNAGTGASSANYQIDTQAPVLSISDNVAGVANGPVTF
ncbi:retention module-containing protein, partial [Pseudomonas leptonychotis]